MSTDYDLDAELARILEGRPPLPDTVKDMLAAEASRAIRNGAIHWT